MNDFDIFSSFAIILLAALTHASFQLSVSVLTLLSSHALGRKTAHLRLLRLTGGFIAGAGVMTVLLVSFVAYVLQIALPDSTPAIIWAAYSGGVVGVGASVWLFYWRKEPGTGLWIPRNFARYLSDRSKATKTSVETFGLGLTSIIGELLFAFAPIAISSLVLIRLSPDLQLLGILLYAGVSLLPLLIVGLLIGGGHKLSDIQRWRETNKSFLQFAAGSGLLVLGAFVYVQQVMVTAVSAVGGPIMGQVIDVVKRSGKRPTEAFNADKLLHSIRSACLSVRSPEGEAEDTANQVVGAVILWCQTKPAVTSHDIRRITSAHLQRFHPEAAYLYQHHKHII